MQDGQTTNELDKKARIAKLCAIAREHGEKILSFDDYEKPAAYCNGMGSFRSEDRIGHRWGDDEFRDLDFFDKAGNVHITITEEMLQKAEFDPDMDTDVLAFCMRDYVAENLYMGSWRTIDGEETDLGQLFPQRTGYYGDVAGESCVYPHNLVSKADMDVVYDPLDTELFRQCCEEAKQEYSAYLAGETQAGSFRKDREEFERLLAEYGPDYFRE